MMSYYNVLKIFHKKIEAFVEINVSKQLRSKIIFDASVSGMSYITYYSW